MDVERDQIKTRERVRDLAEVYTHKREIDAMLDLIPDKFGDIDTRFLEPACGNGNFLVEILARKLRLINGDDHGGTDHWHEFAALRSVSSIYGIDINEANVSEARERMASLVNRELPEAPSSGFRGALSMILDANIVCGDTINDADKIRLIEWEAGEDETFARTLSFLEEPERNLFYVEPESLEKVHYSELVPAGTP